MKLDKLTGPQVVEVELATGVPLVYEIDKNLEVLKKEIRK
jgi:2,3-bisphosphoglycerate-dependent phosphoglycerate mutase